MTARLIDPPAVGRTDALTQAQFACIVDELTRRGLLTGGLGTAALLGLAACADAAAGGHPSARSSPTTRLVGSAHGPIAVSLNPRRVVCVDAISCSVLLELGVTPVGVPLRLETTVALDDVTALGPIAKVADLNDGPDLEKVAALHPDLILGADDSLTPYDKLSAIAPTVLINEDKIEDWPAQTSAFADALGLAAGNDALRARYQQQAARIKRDYAAMLSTSRWAVVFGIGDGKFWLYYPDSQAATALTVAGARYTSAVQGRRGNYVEMSVEKLHHIADADAIAVYSENDGSMQQFQVEELFNQRVWKRLPAVQAGHVFGFARLFPMSFGGAIDELDEFEMALKTLKLKTRD